MECAICHGNGSVPRRAKPSQCRSGEPTSCVSCSNLARLDQRIEETEALLARLMHERQELLHTINEEHDPFILRLPREIASHIFRLCMPTEVEDFGDESVLDDEGFLEEHDPNLYTFKSSRLKEPQVPGLLGAVCYQWRRIACSTPQLWSTIPISLWKRNLDTQLEVLGRWVEWSGGLSLSIAIWTLVNYWKTLRSQTGDLAAWQPTFDFVNRLAPRWRCLRIVLPGFALPCIVGNGEFPFHLQELRIECLVPRASRGEYTTQSFSLTRLSKFPRPRRLEIKSILLKNVNVDLSGVTEIRLIDYHIEECLAFLHDLPRLQRLTVWGTQDGESLRISLQNRLAHLRHVSLRAFAVQDLSTKRDGRCLFDFLTLPALEEMDNNCYEHMGSLVSMITRSRCAIEKLATYNSPTRKDIWSNLFSVVPSCTDLRLWVADATDASLFQCFMPHPRDSALPEDPSESIAVAASSILPNLATLNLELIFTEAHSEGRTLRSDSEPVALLHSVYIPRILEFFVPQQQTTRPLRTLDISLYKYWEDEAERPALDPKAREHISRLASAGIDVTVTETETGQDFL